jgi:hypothetical protein
MYIFILYIYIYIIYIYIKNIYIYIHKAYAARPWRKTRRVCICVCGVCGCMYVCIYRTYLCIKIRHLIYVGICVCICVYVHVFVVCADVCMCVPLVHIHVLKHDMLDNLLGSIYWMYLCINKRQLI